MDSSRGTTTDTSSGLNTYGHICTDMYVYTHKHKICIAYLPVLFNICWMMHVRRLTPWQNFTSRWIKHIFISIKNSIDYDSLPLSFGKRKHSSTYRNVFSTWIWLCTKVCAKQRATDLSIKSHLRYYSKKSNRKEKSLKTSCGSYEDPWRISSESLLPRTLKPFSRTLLVDSSETWETQQLSV